VQYQFKISGFLHHRVYQHLIPGDGMEAVGILLCGQHYSNDHCILLAREFHPIDYDQCERGGDFVRWKTELIIHLLEKANKQNLSLLKIHSHPGGFNEFSRIDDESDNKLLPSVYGWMDGDQPHGSCVLLPDGEIFGRIISMHKGHTPFSRILLAGHEIKIWPDILLDVRTLDEEITLRNRQTLGEGTAALLKSMRVGVVGASGTGSPVIEQLARLGVGELILCDPDVVEFKNLNRILNTTHHHAETTRVKVEVIAESINNIGFQTRITTYGVNLYDSKEAIKDLARCDVLFGCMDSVDGRHLLNQIATFYIVPYFDLGIKIEADGLGGIDQINGVVHYLQPGGSSLLTRGSYSMKSLEAAGLKRKNPEEYNRRVAEKYIVNLPVERPAVISINMQVASTAVNEFLDRIHRFKNSAPSSRAVTWIVITENLSIYEDDGQPDPYLEKRVGRGDMIPILEMPEL
jgi:hypothetical protein